MRDAASWFVVRTDRSDRGLAEGALVVTGYPSYAKAFAAFRSAALVDDESGRPGVVQMLDRKRRVVFDHERMLEVAEWTMPLVGGSARFKPNATDDNFVMA